jgi:hypothetical protein
MEVSVVFVAKIMDMFWLEIHFTGCFARQYRVVVVHLG